MTPSVNSLATMLLPAQKIPAGFKNALGCSALSKMAFLLLRFCRLARSVLTANNACKATVRTPCFSFSFSSHVTHTDTDTHTHLGHVLLNIREARGLKRFRVVLLGGKKHLRHVRHRHDLPRGVFAEYLQLLKQKLWNGGSGGRGEGPNGRLILWLAFLI